MASNNNMGELKPLEHGAVEAHLNDLGSHDVRATDHIQSGDPEHAPDGAAKVEERQADIAEHQADIQLPELDANTQTQPGYISHEAVVLKEKPSGIATEQTNSTEATSCVLTDVPNGPTVPQEEPSYTALKQSNCTKSTLQIFTGVPQTEAAEHQPYGPSADIPEALRGNPYMLSGSLTVANRGQGEEVDKGDESMADAPADVTMLQDMEPHTIDHCEGEGEVQPTQRRQESHSRADEICSASHDAHDTADDQGDEHGVDHTMSVDDESSDGSGASENEELDLDEAEYRAQLKAKIREAQEARMALEQDHQSRHGRLKLQITRQGNNSTQPRTRTEIGSEFDFIDHRAPRYAHQNSSLAVDAHGFAPQYPSGPHHMLQFQQHNAPYPSPFQPPGQQDRSMSNNFLQDQMYMSSAAPFMYARPGPGFQQHHSLGPMDYQNMQYHGQSYGEAQLHQGYSNFPPSPYEMPAQRYAGSPSNRWSQDPLAMPAQRNTQSRTPQQNQDAKEDDCTDDDDDKPLRTRAPQRQSVLGNSDESSPAPVPKTPKRGKPQDEGNESEIQFVSSKPSMGFKASRPKSTAPKSSSDPQTPQDSKFPTKESISSNSPINWKLPQYEATFEPPKTKDDTTVAKISIPGLVREEILLSPDHAEQETHLLLNVFMPAQQALATPDTSPAQAVLNFHTIAVMVIEAYIQFEIGDEFGTGRGHWHSDHDRTDTEYKRLRDAKDADTDEIFFAVIDRWRAGTESNKQPSKMIRGAQEFCDVALDVVFYIKENGLLASEKWKEEERIKKKEKEEKKAKGARNKRGAQKASEPTVRKKVKTGKEKVVENKKKGRASTAAVTVIRRK
jgi:hypothetical protein